MEETQILFRLPKKTLSALDDAISSNGFKTRNEWFRAQTTSFLKEARRKRLRELLERTTVEGIKDEDVAEMVKEWRAKKRGKGTR